VTRRRLVAGGGDDAGDEAIAALVRGGEMFWLDVLDPGPQEAALLHGALGLPPSDMTEAERWSRRPAFSDQGGWSLVVLYGASPPGEDGLGEVHCLVGRRFVVTLRRQDCPALEEAAARVVHAGPDISPALVVAKVTDALVESLLPLVTELDERGEDLGDLVLEDATAGVQREILDTRRRLIGLRRVVMPQRDAVGRLSDAEDDELPGVTKAVSRHLRNSYDRMVRVGDALDAARDAAQAATDVYLATVNNRLNQVMKQLTVIAGIFLPITFVTGFFGQNFSWLVDRIGGAGWFWGLAVAMQLAIVVVLATFFRRRGWF
jgi:magnesium transporter